MSHFHLGFSGSGKAFKGIPSLLWLAGFQTLLESLNCQTSWTSCKQSSGGREGNRFSLDEGLGLGRFGNVYCTMCSLGRKEEKRGLAKREDFEAVRGRYIATNEPSFSSSPASILIAPKQPRKTLAKKDWNRKRIFEEKNFLGLIEKSVIFPLSRT